MTLRDPRLLLTLPLALLAVATTLALASLALADRDDGGADDATELARLAVDADPTVAEPAIAALRALGPDGHAALMTQHAAAIDALRRAPPLAPDAATERLRHAIDVVSGQRDGHASGLYWFTDLDLARAEARRTGRPILGLRLLGRLDEELSCANSRFFRVVLYSNETVARALADGYVLHWSSVRPAPRITIDLGDGRRIERTITGNSVHYLLDASGRPLDALPGLYAPEQFLAALAAAREIATECAPLREGAFRACVGRHHGAALAALEQRWATRRTAISGLPEWSAMIAASTPAAPEDPDAPSAIEAMPLTVGKMAIETPMLRALARDPASVSRPDPIDWRTAAAVEAVLTRLDARSLALLRLKTGRADVATLASELASVAATDGVRNEATMRRRVHEWMREDAQGLAWSALDERVYRELFLTSASDPWLGLGAGDLWDAVEIGR